MSAEIDEIAARWAARADRSGLSEKESCELDKWLRADRRHAGAFARARAVLEYFNRAAALGSAKQLATADALSPRVPRLGRRVWWASLAAAFAVVAVLGFVQIRSDRLATNVGEVRRVALADGSSVTLNTATRLAIDFSERARHVELVEGEAFFDVAKDRVRPFVVRAGDTQVRAVGTSFSVRRLPGEPLKVLVTEGVVEIDRPRDTEPIKLRAQQRAAAIGAGAVEPIAMPKEELERALAWQHGMISLDGISLREAAREFARYSETRILIDDSSLAERKVTGLFSAADPVGFARAVATTMDLEVETGPQFVRLRR